MQTYICGRTPQEEWQENGSLMLMTKVCGNDILLVSKLRPSKEGLFLLPNKGVNQHEILSLLWSGTAQ